MNNTNKDVDAKSRPLWQADYQHYEKVTIQDVINYLTQIFQTQRTT